MQDAGNVKDECEERIDEEVPVTAAPTKVHAHWWQEDAQEESDESITLARAGVTIYNGNTDMRHGQAYSILS